MSRNMDVAGKIQALRSFYHQEKRIPSYQEMVTLLGYRSKNAVFGFLTRLEEEGYLTRQDGKVSFTEKLRGSVRILGTVQAGFPSPAEEQSADCISLDEYLIRQPEQTYMLVVNGDSMIDAGIHAGDIVLVEKNVKPKQNDIVVAQVDDEWTLKHYVTDAVGVRLEPANPKYRFIRPKRSLVIGGVVRAVIRRYP